MARNIPNGSTATKDFPETPAVVVPESTWTVEYAIDFTDEGTHNFSSSATKDLTNNGKTVTWTAANVAASDKFELTSSGLEIDPKGGGQHIWQQTMTLPFIHAKLTDMMTSLSDDDTVAIQLYMDSSPVPSANYDSYGLNLWNLNNGSTQKYLHLRYYYNTAPSAQKYLEAFNESGGYDTLAQSTVQTFFEIVLYPGNGATARTGVFDTTFPTPLAASSFDTFASLSAIGIGGGGGTSLPSFAIPKAEASFVIHAQRQSSGTSFTTTSYKMRVLRRKKT